MCSDRPRHYQYSSAGMKVCQWKPNEHGGVEVILFVLQHCMITVEIRTNSACSFQSQLHSASAQDHDDDRLSNKLLLFFFFNSRSIRDLKGFTIIWCQENILCAIFNVNLFFFWCSKRLNYDFVSFCWDMCFFCFFFVQLIVYCSTEVGVSIIYNGRSGSFIACSDVEIVISLANLPTGLIK